MAYNGNYYVALDIGTSKVAVLVGDLKEDGDFEVIGVGEQKSKGLRNGVITDIESTVEAIRKAVMEAENMSGVEINSVHVGISGHHVRGFESHGIIKVDGKEITRDDMEAVVDQAKAVAIPTGRKLLHTIVREYIVDGQAGIKVPLGISGIRLEVKVYIVAVANAAMENIIRSCNKAELTVADIVLSPRASTLSTLTEDEIELGVAMVDIGGGTTDIVVFMHGSVVHASVLSLGGDLITNDIAVGLRTPMRSAEKIKREHGCAQAGAVPKGETVNIPKVGNNEIREVSKQVLCDIIEARADEIVEQVHKEIQRTGLEELLGAGVVLTGGFANLPDIDRLAEEQLDMPVRCASPTGVTGLVDVVDDPKFASSVGLLLYASKYPPAFIDTSRPRYSLLWDRFRNWLGDLV